MEVTTSDLSKLKVLLDAFPYYVLIVDEDHRIILANGAFEEVVPDAVGKYCPQAVHGSNEPIPECPLEEAVLMNKNVAEREVYDPSGKWFISAVYRTGLTLKGKRLFIHTLHDITEKKLYEQKLKKLNRLLEEVLILTEGISEEKDINTIAKEVAETLSRIYGGSKVLLEINGEKREVKKGELRENITLIDHRNHGSVALELNGNLSEEEVQIIHTFACTLSTIIEKMRLEEERRALMEKIQDNVYQMAVLVDHIRNPLTAIALEAERLGSNKILENVERINNVVKKLEDGWIESENIWNMLKKSWER